MESFCGSNLQLKPINARGINRITDGSIICPNTVSDPGTHFEMIINEGKKKNNAVAAVVDYLIRFGACNFINEEFITS